MNLTPIQVGLKKTPQAPQNKAAQGQFKPAQNTQPQFGGPDLGSYFRMMAKLSATMWAGAATAGIALPLQSSFRNSTEQTQLAHIQASHTASEAKVAASLKALESAPEGQGEAAIAKHRALVKGEILDQVELLKATVSSNTQNDVLREALSKSTLSAEDQETVNALVGETQLKAWKNPENSFNRFADTVLSKHADAETVAQSKAVMRELMADAKDDQVKANILLGIGILGSLAAAGVFGFSALGGKNGIVMVALMGPLMAAGTVRELINGAIKGKKRPAPVPVPAEKPEAKQPEVKTEAQAENKG